MAWNYGDTGLFIDSSRIESGDICHERDGTKKCQVMFIDICGVAFLTKEGKEQMTLADFAEKYQYHCDRVLRSIEDEYGQSIEVFATLDD